MDQDTNAGQIADYQCGNLTYDGHLGTDFVIRDFSQMDSGVYVLAAADGRVYFTKDGEFDRSKQQDTGGYGNFISINHGDSLYTLYAHLKKNSSLVNVGDTVTQGQRIAKVGSSGKTTDPHLHFEVYQYGLIIDPFGQICPGQPQVPAMIVFLPQYDNDLQYINSNVASGILGLDSVRENPHQSYFTTRDSFITYWVHGLSIGGGNILRTDWYQPSGALWFSHLDTLNENYRYWYYYTYINGPAVQASMPLGTWKVRYYVQDQPFDSLTFEIRQLGVHNQREKHLFISPNPARNYILVDGNHRDIKLFDALGRELKLQVNYHTKPIRIDLNGLPSGAYNLQLKDMEGQVLVEKVIIQ
jgi:murein DD-endopeptidase MepM/ murein hydrolase activator NlpD